MPAGQEVAFEPALALMLAQHLQNAAIRSHMVIDRDNFSRGTAVRDLEDCIPAVGCGEVDPIL